MANNPVLVVSILQLYIIPDVERVAYVTLNAHSVYAVCCVCVCIHRFGDFECLCTLAHIYIL